MAAGESGLLHATTGAGKTSILDAVCLALFDAAPRLRGARGVRIGQGALTLGVLVAFFQYGMRFFRPISAGKAPIIW